MKKPLTALALAAAAVVTLAVPAGAAVPKKPATQTLPCNDGSGKSARVWTTGHKLAVENPCRTEWLIIPYGRQYASGDYDGYLDVLPGVHFNWSKKETAAYASATIPPVEGLAPGETQADVCSGDGTGISFVYSYRDVRSC